MTRQQAIFRATFGKLNLGALCLATGGAALLESWALLVSGMALFTCLTFWDVHGNRHRLVPSPPRIPDGCTFKNVTVRSAVEAIGAAQKERLRVVDECADDVLLMLDDLLRTASEIEVTAIRLARRADRLHGYLTSNELCFVRGAHYSAEQSAAAAKTPGERDAYDAATLAYAMEIETLEGIDTGMRVALAKLENIRATLASIPPRIVRLQGASAELGDAASMRLADDLLHANGKLDELEQHLRTVAQTGDAELGIEGCRIAPSVDLRFASAAVAAEQQQEEPASRGAELRPLEDWRFQ